MSASAYSINPVEWISSGVSTGIDKAMENSADSLVGAATNTTVNSSSVNSDNPLNNFLLNMLSGDYDPTTIPWVISTRNFTALVFIILAILYFTIGGGYHILHDAWPEIGSEIDWILGTNYRDFYFSSYIATGVKAFLFPVLGYFGLNYVLLIASAFTRLTISDTLSSLAPSQTDGIVYLFIGICVFALAIFVILRYIIITLFSAYLLIVLGAYLFDTLRPLAIVLLKYLLIIIFMPFVLAMVASGGIAFIEGTPFLGFSKTAEYTALILLMVIVALVMIFGWAFIKKSAKTAAAAAFVV